jgi:hypothetical protein
MTLYIGYPLVRLSTRRAIVYDPVIDESRMPSVTVRADLAEAHRLAWDHLARPGSWWTGEQRLELARTTMLALADDDPLPPWVGVSTTDRVAGSLRAPPAAHDLAYRLARHAGTMTHDVYRATAAQIGELPYVEVCAIVSTVAAVWHFARNVGLAVAPLPAPVGGAPTGERPASLAQSRLNWVPVAPPADAVAAVVQAYTAVPGEHVNTWRMAEAQYMPEGEMVDPAWTRRPDGLSRAQMELVAARLTKLRDCFY